jgi:hypothetical protein
MPNEWSKIPKTKPSPSSLAWPWIAAGSIAILASITFAIVVWSYQDLETGRLRTSESEAREQLEEVAPTIKRLEGEAEKFRADSSRQRELRIEADEQIDELRRTIGVGAPLPESSTPNASTAAVLQAVDSTQVVLAVLEPGTRRIPRSAVQLYLQEQVDAIGLTVNPTHANQLSLDLISAETGDGIIGISAVLTLSQPWMVPESKEKHPVILWHTSQMAFSEPSEVTVTCEQMIDSMLRRLQAARTPAP